MKRTPGRAAAVITGIALLATGCAGTDAPGEAGSSSPGGERSAPAAPSAGPSSPSGPSRGPTAADATPSADPTTPAPASGSVDVDRTVIADREQPWGLAELPGGDLITTSRDQHQVHRVDPGSGAATRLGSIEEAVSDGGEGGLLGVAVPPDFARSQQLYFYYTSAQDNRIVRMDYDADRQPGQQLQNAEVLVDQIPSGSIHNGGRIAFGPDGMLYAGTGEAGQTSLSQDRSSLGGKILAMTPDGDPAPDNPRSNSLVYSYGHRNVQGLAWDAAGRLWAAEFGQNTYDELNLIEPGNNYGWPEAEGRSDNNAFTDPVAQWGTDENSPSGIAFAGGAIWMAALQGERLWRIPLDGTEPVAEPESFLTGEYGRLRSVHAVDEDTLLLSTSNTDGRGDPAGNDDRILELTVD